nr:immunoglobulin heavy chain junction region [Mus musculus]
CARVGNLAWFAYW